MIPNTQSPLAPIVADLCEEHGIQKLAVFGSALRQDFSAHSDLDLLVHFKPGRTPGLAFFQIQEELSQLLKRTVDLQTAESLSPYFRDEVLAAAKDIYVAP